MSLSVSLFTIFILLIVYSLSIGGLKILFNNFFSFDPQKFLWIKYSLFYFVSYGIYLLVSFTFPYDNLSKVITFILIIVGEIAIFYFKYYTLDSKSKYATFVIFSSMANLLLFRFLNIVLFTVFVISFA